MTLKFYPSLPAGGGAKHFFAIKEILK